MFRTLTFSFLICLFSFSYNLAQDKTVIATVDGTSIIQGDIDYLIAGEILPLQEQIDAIRKIALENYITKLLLEKEAKRKRISVLELKKSLTNVNVDITAEEVESEYLKNREAFGLMNSEEAKERIRLDLINFAKMREYRTSIEQLEKNAKIVYFNKFFAQKVEIESQGPVLGNKNAKVSIVEFSDFLCPYCKKSQEVIKQVMRKYDGEVNLVFKHLPLQSNSHILARASVCADKQGRFWEYHDQLFEIKNLSEKVPVEIAKKLNLDVADFKSCMKADDSKSIITRDQNEARRLGLASTPTFIINGTLIRGAIELEEFIEIIEFHKKLQQQK